VGARGDLWLGDGSAVSNWLVALPNLEELLRQLADIAPHWVYGVIGVGVAIENFFPPIPADTFVLLGAFLSAHGRVTGLGVFAVTWAMNTAAALLNYGLARRWGRLLLNTRSGRWLLRPRQLDRLAALYHSHGSKIIFFSRFLPAFRVLVPVFAGISHLSFWRTVLPVAAAGAIWYGLLVLAGALAGRNWQVIVHAFDNVNSVLLVVATLLAALLGGLWWKTRHHPPEHVGEGTEQ
jgi:membrane protein DedA with SNARE-associated domain